MNDPVSPAVALAIYAIVMIAFFALGWGARAAWGRRRKMRLPATIGIDRPVYVIDAETGQTTYINPSTTKRHDHHENL